MASCFGMFFGSCPCPGIKHFFFESANAIFEKENFGRKETLRRTISPVKFRHAANGAKTSQGGAANAVPRDLPRRLPLHAAGARAG
jgi:hypothetical protein